MRRWIALAILLAGCDAPFVDRMTRVVVEPGQQYWDEASGALLVPVTGRLDRDTLPEDTLDRDATVFLTSLGPVPARAAFGLALELDEAEERLVATPEPLAANTRYALVVTDFVRDENNSRVGRTRAFNDAWEGNADADESLRRDALEVRGALVRDRVPLEFVAGAVVIETDGTGRPE